ncbi:potassium voltage-gated channel subfamily H member 6-like [Montipora capricornis]|uniref:potassium voltage-gated channel subfamily H member 6-like n=1 Tax=Montipora capricornis TaxID=246305 RepID=UPI0035F14B73
MPVSLGQQRMSSALSQEFSAEQRQNKNETGMSSKRKLTTRKLTSWTIHHKSIFKVTWDWFVLALVIYTSIEIPFATAFLGNDSQSIWKKLSSREPREIVNVVVDVMFIIDIIINFRTTFLDNASEAVISEPKKIAIHYLKTWFVVDFVAAIPFDFFIPTGAEGVGTNKLNEAVKLAGFLKTARLLRLIRVSRKMDRYSEFGLAVIFLLTAFFALIAHWLACVWNVIGEREKGVPYGWIQLLGDTIGSEPGVGTRYVTALYFTITSLTSIGFGNVAPNTDNEKIFAVLMMLTGALFYAVIFGNLTAIIQRLYSRTARYHQDVRVVNECIAIHGLPESLQTILRAYFTSEQAATRGDEIESIMYRFPESLQAEIRLRLSHRLFELFSIFDGLNDACLRALACVFRAEFFPHQVYLLKEGDQVTRLYFIVSGSVDVMQGTQCTMCLGPGDIAGCNILLQKRRPGHCLKSSVSLVAKVRTEAYLVTWKDLLHVTRVYPEMRKCLMNQMELSCDLQSSGKENEEQDRLDVIHVDSSVVHINGFSDDETVGGGEFVSISEQPLERLEAKLSYMEDTLSEIKMYLQNNDRSADNLRLSMSNSFSKTSIV